MWLRTAGQPEPHFLPRPNGNSYTMLATITWRLSKSERERSSRKLGTSVGVRLFEVLRPPPVEAPTGSIDMSSIDLLRVEVKPRSSPFSNRLRTALKPPR